MTSFRPAAAKPKVAEPTPPDAPRCAQCGEVLLRARAARLAYTPAQTLCPDCAFDDIPYTD